MRSTTSASHSWQGSTVLEPHAQSRMLQVLQSGIEYHHYNCVTERFDPSSVASIMVGLFTEIPHWKHGSTIKLAAYAGGYPQPGEAQFAAFRLWEAGAAMEQLRPGRQFWVGGKLEDAAFVLEYGGDKGNVLASAFFPNPLPLNTLSVYQPAPSGQYRGILKNIFLHELGHTLGLRYEFASIAF
jgi:hypothetical protein